MRAISATASGGCRASPPRSRAAPCTAWSARSRARSGCGRSPARTATRARRGSGTGPAARGSGPSASTTWNAPAAMNSTWSVFTGPYLVVTVEPSTIGSRSRCTPSRETSGPWPPVSRPAILSISSMKMMPACSARRIASFCSRSRSISLVASSSVSTSSASGTDSRRRFVRRAPCGSMSRRFSTISSMPVPENTSMNDGGASAVSISTSLVELPVAQQAAQLLARGVVGRRLGRGRRRAAAASWSWSRRPAGAGAARAAAARRAAAPRRSLARAGAPARAPPRAASTPRSRPGRAPSTRRRGRRSRPR